MRDSPTFDEVVKVLDRTTYGGARWRDDDSVTGCCPAHDDRTPSLSAKRAGDKVLLYCHAGCSYDSVKAAFLRLLDPTTPLSERQQRELKARVRPAVASETVYEIRDVDGALVGVVGLPTTFLVGRDGRAVAFAVGPREWGSAPARALFTALLAEPAPGPSAQ